MLPYRPLLDKSASHISGTMRGLKGKRMETDPPWLDLTINDVLSPPTLAVRTGLVRLVEEAVLDRNDLAIRKLGQLVGLLVKRHIGKMVRSPIFKGNVLYSAEDLEQDLWLFLVTGSRSTSKERTKQALTPTKSPLLTWTGEQAFGWFISRCVYNYLIDRSRNSLRGNIQRLYHDSGDSVDRIADDKISPEKETLLHLCCQRCWERLHPSDREILESVALGFSQAEIAKERRVSEATISRWRKGAEDRLRTCLKNECPGDYWDE